MTRWEMKETMKERKKFKHWISPMSKQCQGQNRQKETCRSMHTRTWKTTQIPSNLFTQQAQKDDNVPPQIWTIVSYKSNLIYQIFCYIMVGKLVVDKGKTLLLASLRFSSHASINKTSRLHPDSFGHNSHISQGREVYLKLRGSWSLSSSLLFFEDEVTTSTRSN